MSNTTSSSPSKFAWLAYRLAVGFFFFWYYTNASWGSGFGDKLTGIAMIVCGIACFAGVLVRPALLVILGFLLYNNGWKVNYQIHLEQFGLLVGLFIGGGGNFLSVGAILAPLKGKWWQ